jgi:hypothetical protein
MSVTHHRQNPLECIITYVIPSPQVCLSLHVATIIILWVKIASFTLNLQSRTAVLNLGETGLRNYFFSKMIARSQQIF